MSTEGNSKNSPFEYLPLKPGEIRVLELLPRDQAAPIECRLRHIILDDKAHYEAVSYVWGHEEHDQAINVNDSIFLVTPNVEAALRAFRVDATSFEKELIETAGEGTIATKYLDVSGSRLLWIDAICINQGDLDERAEQVKLMGTIYEFSVRMLVWLGVEENGSEEAMDFAIERSVRARKGADVCEEWLKTVFTSPGFEKLFESLSAIFSRPWARRTWILQEFVLGHTDDMLFFCGSKHISYLDFKESAIDDDIITELVDTGAWEDQKLQTRIDFIQGSVRLESLQQAHDLGTWIGEIGTGEKAALPQKYEPNALSLEYWLNLNRSSTASEPRDKVFAVLGVCGKYYHHSFNLEDVIIDYESPVEDVYSSVVKAIVGASGCLDILASCSPKSQFVRRSWTPDWSSPGKTSYFRGHGAGTTFKSCFTSSGNSSFIGSFSSDWNVLEVTGLMWDSVKEVLPLEESECEPSNFRVICRAVWDYMKSLPAYGSEAEAKKALWRTLVTTPYNSMSSGKLSMTDVLYYPTPRIISDLSNPDYYDILQSWPDDYSAPCWMNQDYQDSFKDYRLREYRTIVVTSEGYIGQILYDGGVKPGDVICVLLGCNAPMILRPVESHYIVIGDIYVDGIMHGEAMRAYKQGKVALQTFKLR